MLVKKVVLTEITAAIDVNPSPLLINRMKREGCQFVWLEGHIYQITLPEGVTQETVIIKDRQYQNEMQVLTFPSGWQVRSRYYRPDTVALRWYPGRLDGTEPLPEDIIR